MGYCSDGVVWHSILLITGTARFLTQENTMRNTRARRLGIVTLFGVLVLSIGLVRLSFMASSAGAAPPNKSGNLSTSTQNWDESLPSSSRFTVLANFGGAAVRDNNTGLVWEQAPDTTSQTWVPAVFACVNKTVGGTTGWRLPSVIELNSVRDPSLPTPFVPTSIFTGVQSNAYWSATTHAQDSNVAWWVNTVFGGLGSSTKDQTNYVWCVRGPMNAATY
jgi:hypothetical protein